MLLHYKSENKDCRGLAIGLVICLCVAFVSINSCAHKDYRALTPEREATLYKTLLQPDEKILYYAVRHLGESYEQAHHYVGRFQNPYSACQDDEFILTDRRIYIHWSKYQSRLVPGCVIFQPNRLNMYGYNEVDYVGKYKEFSGAKLFAPVHLTFRYAPNRPQAIFLEADIWESSKVINIIKSQKKKASE